MALVAVSALVFGTVLALEVVFAVYAVLFRVKASG
jgi:hypothetical protein